MIQLGFGLLAGALFTLLFLRLRLPRLTVTNFRGSPVKVVGGLVLAAALAKSELLTLFLGGYEDSKHRLGLLVVVVGFFLLGLIDDAFGDRSAKGLGGHLKALLHGVVTTGSVKAFGGLALAGLVGLWWERSIPLAILDGLAIALSANFLNLLDLRPGRAGKAFLLLWLPLVFPVRSSEFLEVSAALAGGTMVWLFADLRERGMFGDAGANMLGAALGAGVVLGMGAAGRIVVVVALIALTLISERWSFTAAIERFAPLRWVDRLGRK